MAIKILRRKLSRDANSLAITFWVVYSRDGPDSIFY